MSDLNKNIDSFFEDYTNNLKDGLASVDPDKLGDIVNLLENSIKSGKTIFTCGNGGSSAISEHFVCDFFKGTSTSSTIQPIIHSLSSNVPTLTAIANDISYDEIFSYQIERYGVSQDVLLCVSSSGNSENIIRAIKKAKSMDIKTISFVGFDGGEAKVTKAAIEPVWHLPGIAKRFKINETDLRHSLFEFTGGMFTELVTRPDIKVFLPPIGNISIYVFGDIETLHDRNTPLTCRVHDECNGSDVFGSDICTCRPYLTHGIEESIRMAQAGGAGLIVYNRKEGRALGEVTKFLVYNARKRAPGGDTAETYFERTECVAGVEDVRFQDLMPDIFHWLGVTSIDRFVSMSDMKFDALIAQGIKIIERVPIPDNLIPIDAQVEMEAKKAAGYFTKTPGSKSNKGLGQTGRAIDEY